MKAAVVKAIRAGLITREQAYDDYLLSPEELAVWETAFDQGGHTNITGKARRRWNQAKPGPKG
jgi:hypothetical protein